MLAFSYSYPNDVVQRAAGGRTQGSRSCDPYRRRMSICSGARSVLAFILCLGLGGCRSLSSAPSDGSAMKLAMVTDIGGLGDKSFNDLAYRGLQEAKARFGAQVQVLQSKSAADFQPNLTVPAEEGEDEIFAVGFLITEDLAQVARDFPQRRFALIDSVVDEPNVVSVTFREQESSFLAGALAAMVSKTRTIAFLGGMDVPVLRRFEAGFIAGAREIDPKISVLVKYVGSFEDAASGKEFAGVLFDEKADVVFIAAGKSGLGALDELRDRPGVFGIGVDSDQDAMAPGKILTSVLKHVDIAVLDIVRRMHAGLLPHGHLELGLKEGGIGLTSFPYTRRRIGAAHIAMLAVLRRAIVGGKIVPPDTREKLASFKPVSL
jgi:basic membrane protein A and related proteins